MKRRKCLLAKKSALEQILQIPAAIKDAVNMNRTSLDAKNYAIWFEMKLTKISYVYPGEFRWNRTTVWGFLQAKAKFLDFIEHMLRSFRAVMMGDIFTNFRKVSLGSLGKINAGFHFWPRSFDRTDLTDWRTVLTFPSAISCWLWAIILSIASDSCVCSYDAISCTTAFASPFCVITRGDWSVARLLISSDA